MSFRYKSALLSLLSMAAVYGWYFTWAAMHRAPGGEAVHLSGTVLLLALIQIVGNILLAATSSDARCGMDERERSFDRRATGTGYYLLLAGIILWGAWLRTGATNSAAIANGVLALVVIAEGARQAMFLILHHRAA